MSSWGLRTCWLAAVIFPGAFYVPCPPPRPPRRRTTNSGAAQLQLLKSVPLPPRAAMQRRSLPLPSLQELRPLLACRRRRSADSDAALPEAPPATSCDASQTRCYCHAAPQPHHKAEPLLREDPPQVAAGHGADS